MNTGYISWFGFNFDREEKNNLNYIIYPDRSIYELDTFFLPYDYNLNSLIYVFSSLFSSFESRGYYLIKRSEPLVNIYTDSGGDFLFEKIWVEPDYIAIGFITEDIERTVSIWNSSRYNDVSFGSVSAVNETGMEFLHYELPIRIQQFGEQVYTFAIDGVGPPLQDTTYTFGIDSFDFNTRLVGLRVLPFGLDPDWDNSPEIQYEFQTVIFTSGGLNEQRRALSDKPTMKISGKYTVFGNNSKRIFNMLSYGHDKVFGVPIYNEKIRVVAANPGSDMLTTYTSDFSNYFNITSGNGFVTIIDHINNLVEIKEIQERVGNSFTFTQEIVNNFSLSKEIYLYPVVFCTIGALKMPLITDSARELSLEFLEFKNG